MSITDRDRKILMALIPLAVIAAYWFLLLAPKREEAGAIKEQLTEAQGLRDVAQQKASQLSGAKRSFAADYATVIRLGKSIPTSVDMPSLLVQLDRAARGTGIKFTDVKAGDSSGSGAAAPAPAAASAPGGTGPTAAGAPAAQSGAGQAAQSTAGAVNNANASSAAAGGAPAPAAGGGAPAAATPGTGSGAASGTGAPGLSSIPLDFEFNGSFFDLADFFHRMKRFVRVANNRIVVRGRLMTINSFSFDSTAGFPDIKAHVSATVYLAPKAQGIDAGATPAGPAGAQTTPQTASSSSTPTPTPAATVTAP